MNPTKPQAAAQEQPSVDENNNNNNNNNNRDVAKELCSEIVELELRLRDARRRLDEAGRCLGASVGDGGGQTDGGGGRGGTVTLDSEHASPRPGIVSHGKVAVNHALLLLSDSALPLGSFAFSSGLESYLAHHRRRARGSIPGSSSFTSSSSAVSGSPPTPGNSVRAVPSFMLFLSLSLSSVASTALPYVLAAHRSPETIIALDDQYDASLACTVARRASIAQGRALLSVWTRAFAASLSGAVAGDEDLQAAVAAIEELRRASSHPSSSSHRSTSTAPHVPDSRPRGTHHAPFPPSSHFPPLWGAVTRVMAVAAYEAAYVFLLNHVKAVVSAAVRANVLGSYQAQAILVDDRTREAIERALHENRTVAVQNAAQTAPVLDLWMGRHELLYSRIFNS